MEISHKSVGDVNPTTNKQLASSNSATSEIRNTSLVSCPEIRLKVVKFRILGKQII
jgi:hypothetical protein